MPGAPLGNMNAYLDGRYTAQAIAERRKAGRSGSSRNL